MVFAIRLSCILAMLFCLASTGNAGAIDRDRQRLEELQQLSKENTDPGTQVQINHEIVEIYKKYRGKEGADVATEAELNAKVEEFESKIVLVEGVPKQGGALSSFFGFGTYIPDNVKNDAMNLARSSSKALVDGIANYLLSKLWQRIGLGK